MRNDVSEIAAFMSAALKDAPNFGRGKIQGKFVQKLEDIIMLRLEGSTFAT